MKFNTKTMTPINKIAPDTMKSATNNSFFSPNKYIEDGTSGLIKVKQEDDENVAFGSFIRYIPTIFYTPVKSSSRLENKGTLSADGVQDLSKAFEQLLLINSKGEEEEKSEIPEEEESTVDKPETKFDNSVISGDDEKEKEEEDTEKLGRFKTLDTSLKSAPKKVDVIRSYRLLSDQE